MRFVSESHSDQLGGPYRTGCIVQHVQLSTVNMQSEGDCNTVSELDHGINTVSEPDHGIKKISKVESKYLDNEKPQL